MDQKKENLLNILEPMLFNDLIDSFVEDGTMSPVEGMLRKIDFVKDSKQKETALDAMLTATEEYARNIQKMGKPNLTFNQLLHAWYKAMNPPQTDDMIAARCIEMVRNPPAVEMLPFPKTPMGPCR